MIDFKKKIASGKVERKTDPIELYKTLDRKSVAGPLRPAQQVILEKWYKSHRDDKDLIIKLHTGEGKTLIGLLLLQSVLNSYGGSCLYICPNIYLVAQTRAEAQKFGIPFCEIGADNRIPDEFLSGDKILITHAHKIFHGRSDFGLGNRHESPGAIVLDDSHACVDVIKGAFTITIQKNNNEDLFQRLMSLFADDLSDQGEGSFIDMQSGSYETFMPVPYWSWSDKKTEALTMLSEFQEIDSIKFPWPLVRDKIDEYCCYISGTKIEITPYNPNVDIFRAFSKAKRRILMSATTQDDSFFIKGLSFSVDSVKMPLINPLQKWSGEKMVILPSLIDENCDRDLVATRFVQLSTQPFGIVVIVPNTRRANWYSDLGAVNTNSSNIYPEIDKLQKGTFSKIVAINNRYDGIDLPDESCRILIIDSMPFFDSLSDRYEEKCRPNSDTINKRMAQKIEQGIGRGVRGEKDYCAILIIGPDIVQFTRSARTNKYFSAQTRKQIDISLEIADMAKEDQGASGDTLKPIFQLINQMLKRDEGWKEYYVTKMDEIEESSDSTQIYEQLLEELSIEKLFCSGEHEKACARMQTIIDNLKPDDSERGWYLQQLARYKYPVSTEQSIVLQKSAFKANPQLLKPKIGIEYTKVSYINENRLGRIRLFISNFGYYNELLLAIDATLDNLSFGVEAEKFEDALKTVGELLGFISQRPDRDIRKGPDNLWCGINDHYLLFECKSEVNDTRNEINKHEAGQMNNHCGWFDEQYSNAIKVDRFLIIPTKDLSYHGNFTHEVRIIRRGKLKTLKENIKKFLKELRPYELSEIKDESLQRFLNLHHLNAEDFSSSYSEAYYHKTK